MRQIRRAILHCTATEEGKHYDVDDIRRWHTSEPRNWSDIGYHWLILLDGTIQEGRPFWKQGAHVAGHNEDSLGIAYVGGLRNGEPADTMTVLQDIAFLRLITSLRTVFGPILLHGHNEFSSKACPSFIVAEKYKWLVNDPNIGTDTPSIDK